MSFRHPYSAPRQLARARAVGPVPGPHARTDRTRGIRVAEPWLPGGRAAGGGTAPDTRRPSQGIQATGTVLGPIPAHSCPQHVDSWPRQPPGGGQPEEGERPASDAPHNGGRPPGNGGPPPPPRHTAPTGRASQGDSAGPPHPHNRTHGTAADPESPPRGRAVGGGGGA